MREGLLTVHSAGHRTNLAVHARHAAAVSIGNCCLMQVDFETELNIAPYMSNRRAGPQMYELFGVLVHAGHSVHSGHYYCFVRGPNGIWHHMDDTRVSQVRPFSLSGGAPGAVYLVQHAQRALEQICARTHWHPAPQNWQDMDNPANSRSIQSATGTTCKTCSHADLGIFSVVLVFEGRWRDSSSSVKALWCISSLA